MAEHKAAPPPNYHTQQQPLMGGQQPHMVAMQQQQHQPVPQQRMPQPVDNYAVAQGSVSEDEDFCASCWRCILVGCSYACAYATCYCCCCYMKVFDEYQRAVHFRLGKLEHPAKGPGMVWFVPCVDDWQTVDLRVITIDVPPQEMMTKDSVTCKVNAVVYYRVRDAVKAVVRVENHRHATELLAQTTLRSVVGASTLEELLQNREQVNERIRRIIDEASDKWGVFVASVELKDVTLPSGVQRAMGAEAEAERERRAKVIAAKGELQASKTLAEAATSMANAPGALTLRTLQTLNTIAAEHNSTIITVPTGTRLPGMK